MTSEIDVPRFAESADQAELAGPADSARPEKAMSEGAQVVAALIVVACIAAGFWVTAKNESGPGNREPASCSRSNEDDPLSKPVSGKQLCEALNRPDLPMLLGTPDDSAVGAYSSEGKVSHKAGVMTTDPEATVQLDGYSVKLSRVDDGLSVDGMADFLSGSSQRTTVLGHPAVLYTGQTLGFVFKDGKGSTGPGGISRSLLVALNPKDDGGSYEIDIWRQDDVNPDRTALYRIAEKVLPTVPGWTTG
ncbi:DUF6215 domain-containing protein [Streptomyces turgidiscabies]|nr:DUF6215 domain-containing protein [Streptomyces turgidiscabies]MDX3497099.1 DUF6215 domain-containing protein [Streptomyces turgidiscabies]GAQ68752.1 hypothetical protein T45_00467 [Streptomyces turgidiscabies]